tara:strand:- start:5377 stop:6411 length:1035 start_codon:yes stop_codon:yes gene_type:complete
MKFLFGDMVERNISLQVLLSLIIVAVVIGAIDLIFLFLNELSDVSESYSFQQILIYCLKSFPYRLFDLTSYICLIGLIIGIGALTDRGEMIGTQILGKSLASISLAAFRPVLLIMILGIFASEFVIPGLSQSAEENRFQLQDKASVKKGYWNGNKENISFFLSAPERDQILGLTVYEFDENRNFLRSTFAPKANLEEGIWKTQQQEVIFSTKSNSVLVPPSLSLDLDQMLSPKYLPLSNLYLQSKRNYSKYRKKEMSLEFWRKVLQPFITFSLVLLAMSFLIGPMKEQKTGQRILIAIGMAFAFDLSQKLLGSISVVSQIPTITSVLLPPIIIICLSLILLKRT